MLGTIDLWFRLHTSDLRPLHQFLADKHSETRDRPREALNIEEDVHLLVGERDAMTEAQGKLEAERKRSTMLKKKVDMQKQLNSQIQAELDRQRQIESDATGSKVGQRSAKELIQGFERKTNDKIDDDSSKAAKDDIDDQVSRTMNQRPELKKSASSAKKNVRVHNKGKSDTSKVAKADEQVTNDTAEKSENAENNNFQQPFSTLSRKTSSQLESIIKNRAKPPRTLKRKPTSAANPRRKVVVSKPPRNNKHRKEVSDSSETATLESEGPAAVSAVSVAKTTETTESEDVTTRETTEENNRNFKKSGIQPISICYESED